MLSVKSSNDEPQKVISCPKCGAQLKVKFAHQAPEARTVMANMASDKSTTQYMPRRAATHAEQPYGVLIHEGQRFPLKEGRNILGRKAPSSQADIQIEEKKPYMSRMHALIEVHVFDGKPKVSVSNYQNKNATFVDDQRLYDGDVVNLQNGSRITIGETFLTYEL